MQLSSLLTILATAAVTTAQETVPDLKACPERYVGGACVIVSPGQPPAEGTFMSYSWPGGRSGFCAQFCNGCTPIGSTCETQDNGNFDFNKAFVYQWTDGSDGAPCC